MKKLNNAKIAKYCKKCNIHIKQIKTGQNIAVISNRKDHMCVQVFIQCINPFCGVSSKNIDLYLFWYLLTNLYTSPRHHTSTNTSVPTGICEPRWLRLEHWILNYVEFKYQTIFQNVTIFQWVSKCQESLLFGQQYFSLLFTS